jgi:hypothetical protein
MTLPARSSTLYAMIAYLHGALSPSGVQVHGLELPAGWTLRKAALVLPDGGGANVSLPMVEERFTVHSYGAVQSDAIAVDLLVFGALHRAAHAKQVAVSGVGMFYIPTAWRAMGPIYARDPGTEWPRVTSAYMVTISEWVAQ